MPTFSDKQYINEDYTFKYYQMIPDLCYRIYCSCKSFCEKFSECLSFAPILSRISQTKSLH
ncbi:hypothetical protein HETIRDRAFT_162851 [Heterobasidion irregulare TC 32-1]|uniref:Uncharacterized protein n=1 Tax=Heterobasidion irregulare (strain TC 32-1) TaxID=747525 RepID=W4JR93_HETIT|nr:uncharacterized protein HETIRDRAFT_162851 [Heterobasidion irregulare TC 32-1]ETW76092.1 hypothetical protein HETIRDRAFT_162851 [Heterobasidion irregulare TC 32-1]